MMQSTANRKGDQLAWPVDGRRYFPDNGRVAVESLVWASCVAVIVDEILEHPGQVPLAQDDDMIQELPAQRADEPLDVGVLPRAPVGRPHLLDPAALEKCWDTFTVHPVVVSEQIPELPAERRGLSELLDHPIHQGAVRCGEPGRAANAALGRNSALRNVPAQ